MFFKSKPVQVDEALKAGNFNKLLKIAKSAKNDYPIKAQVIKGLCELKSGEADKALERLAIEDHDSRWMVFTNLIDRGMKSGLLTDGEQVHNLYTQVSANDPYRLSPARDALKETYLSTLGKYPLGLMANEIFEKHGWPFNRFSVEEQSIAYKRNLTVKALDDLRELASHRKADINMRVLADESALMLTNKNNDLEQYRPFRQEAIERLRTTNPAGLVWLMQGTVFGFGAEKIVKAHNLLTLTQRFNKVSDEARMNIAYTVQGVFKEITREMLEMFVRNPESSSAKARLIGEEMKGFYVAASKNTFLPEESKAMIKPAENLIAAWEKADADPEAFAAAREKVVGLDIGWQGAKLRPPLIGYNLDTAGMR